MGIFRLMCRQHVTGFLNFSTFPFNQIWLSPLLGGHHHPPPPIPCTFEKTVRGLGFKQHRPFYFYVYFEGSRSAAEESYCVMPGELPNYIYKREMKYHCIIIYILYINKKYAIQIGLCRSS
jgi:hypothetical protein